MVVGLVIVMSGAQPAAGAIQVRSEEGATLAKFTSLNCKENKRGFVARGKGTGGWRLDLHIEREAFSGYHKYEIEYGPEHPVFFFVTPRGGPSHSNIYEPDTDIPRLTLGGAVTFKKRGRVVRIAYPIAYVHPGVPPWVTLIGQAPCR